MIGHDAHTNIPTHTVDQQEKERPKSPLFVHTSTIIIKTLIDMSNIENESESIRSTNPSFFF
jgi:hypothetical protein